MRPVGRDLGVHELLHTRREAFGQRVEFEVHAALEWFHVPAGYRLAPLVPDHAAQHVHRRVRAHEPVTAVPVHDAVHCRADRGCRARHRVPHRVTLFADVGHGHAVDRAGVVGLSAARRIERRAVERHALAVDGSDGRVELLQVRVAEIQQLGHGGIVRS